MNEKELKAFYPYSLEEFLASLKRIQSYEISKDLIKKFFPQVDPTQFMQQLSNVKTITEFQKQIISPLIAQILKFSAAEFSINGLENKSIHQKYLFISNHRDIICDPAFFIYSLNLKGFPTPKICLGDNLLIDPLITDLIKMNKGITVKRNLPPRKLLEWSQILSQYIYMEITNNQDSIWIAQREGRAKDGIDKTQPSILKMFSLAAKKNLLQHFADLHLLPISISYEYDPCAFLKARELYLTDLQGQYRKTPEEDYSSMIKGLLEFKGRIHIQVGEEMHSYLKTLPENDSKKNHIHAISKWLDQQIQKNYKLWPSHFIAHDLLNKNELFSMHYTLEEKNQFIEEMTQQFAGKSFTSAIEEEKIRYYFLKTYANSILHLNNPPYLNTPLD